MRHSGNRVTRNQMCTYFFTVCVRVFCCSICVLDFPHCVVHEMPELTAESLVSENTVSQTSIHCQ